MSTHTKEVLAVKPFFDFELMLGLLSEKRLGGKVIEEMAETWERWLPKLHALKIETGKGRYLALWLDPDVEDEVDAERAKSAEYGYRLSALAHLIAYVYA